VATPLAVAALAVLLFTVPANAQQQTTISRDCNSSVTQTSSGGSSVSQQSATQSGDGECVIKQSFNAGGNVSQSIRQVQTSDDDGGVHRVRRHRDRDDRARDDDSGGEAFAATHSQDLNTPSGGVETGGGGTLPVNGAGLPVALAAAGSALALSLIVAGLLGLRRTRSD
jgi:hypothetical protein